MRQLRTLLVSAALLVASVPTPATSTARALVLPEVTKHLEHAKKCLRDGSHHIAMAHADMVLVGDEVTYAVTFQNAGGTMQARCMKSLGAALKSWEDSLDGTVSFKEIEDPSKADIVVRFKPDVRMGQEPVAGFANWKRLIRTEGKRVVESRFTSDLQIRTINVDGEPMPTSAMKHEVMHEVGHVLGLEDCDTVGYLMGPLDISRPVSAPRPHESNAVLSLRSDARRLREEASLQANK